MKDFLESSEYIDWKTPSVHDRAHRLSYDLDSENEIVKTCFEFVRDEIKHSSDFKINIVTCKASEVLEFKTGYCYAKSHLLAALLRANSIPAALCYQRLTIEDDRPPFCIHGLNAVFLKKHGWYRIDARGNKPGVDAQFQPPVEALAFTLRNKGEFDVTERFSVPMESVIETLTTHDSYQSVACALPDLQLQPE